MFHYCLHSACNGVKNKVMPRSTEDIVKDLLERRRKSSATGESLKYSANDTLCCKVTQADDVACRLARVPYLCRKCLIVARRL